ncbi:uncharacterized protein LOC119632461 [Glossina fuscipes]|uniref:Uncharacterized protein LOC119632461 n=1 Tax=Glossina fuscipes TaxID=7396 RepID=A0A8U0W7X7_9MUSC|nr:uncharacterized protein LOC119632461 [Glossina fuscipes]
MESKRSHRQSVHSNKPGSSKTQILKSTSDVSVTPSQAAELAKQNARKNPLDALSKMNARQTPIIERRSGLQDVDEEYLKKNIFTKPLFPRHSGLNDDVYAARQIQNMPAAGQPSVSGSNDDAYAARQLQIQNMPAAGQPSVPPQGDGISVTSSKAHQHNKYHQQQPQQVPPQLSPPQQPQVAQPNLPPSQVQMQVASGGQSHGKNPIATHVNSAYYYLNIYK